MRFERSYYEKFDQIWLQPSFLRGDVSIEHRDVFTFPSRTNNLVEQNCKIRSVSWRKNVFSGVWRSFHLTFHESVSADKFNNFWKVISDKSLLTRGYFFMFCFLSIKNKKKKRNKCFTLKSWNHFQHFKNI